MAAFGEPYESLMGPGFLDWLSEYLVSDLSYYSFVLECSAWLKS